MGGKGDRPAGLENRWWVDQQKDAQGHLVERPRVPLRFFRSGEGFDQDRAQRRLTDLNLKWFGEVEAPPGGWAMTELCSQRYESVLRDRFAGRSLDTRRLVAPPWLRTRVLDPDTLAPVPAGETGLLCHHDLANAGSVSVVLTEDLGRSVSDDGIEIVGRVPGAPPRGCGMLLAELAP